MEETTQIPVMTAEQAESRRYLSGELLKKMHLESKNDPVAQVLSADGRVTYYYDPRHVREASPESWYQRPAEPLLEPIELEDGRTIGRMSTKRAATLNYYTKERLAQMHYDVVAGPVAYTRRFDKSVIYFYDKAEAVRQPLPCVKCGRDIRYRHKLCRACYEKELEQRRVEGDARRTAYYHAKREKTLFFDLELTGVYDHDEILSISVTDGAGRILMDTLVHPAHKRKWKETEKIHGITPEMVADAPRLKDLIPAIKRLFEDADAVIAYGIATDYSHIKYIYDTETERQRLRRKTKCAAIEYNRFVQEHRPEQTHLSLSDAMETLGLTWDGTAHTSIADTIACAKVWEALFPHYYDD